MSCRSRSGSTSETSRPSWTRSRSGTRKPSRSPGVPRRSGIGVPIGSLSNMTARRMIVNPMAPRPLLLQTPLDRSPFSQYEGERMDARLKAMVAGCVMLCLWACAPMTSRESPQHSSETEMLQKATSLAIGNLAWESVRVTDVGRESDKIKWVGLTRSVKYVCNADLKGENSYCDRISLAPPPQMRPGGDVQAGARAAQAMALSRNNVSVAGAERSYFYFVSSKYRPDAYNYVVYALHDNGQTADEFAKQSGWMKIADKNGFVVVFPESADKSWAAN